MKKTVLLTVVFLACNILGFAASPAAGTWDCSAYVDQDYPFTMEIVENDGVLAGSVANTYGESIDLKNLKLEEGVLYFSIDSPEVGMINFKATLDGDSLKGTLEGYDFGGEFTATRKK